MKPEWFAGRLRELREAAGLTRNGLAELAGLKSEAGIRNLEQDIRKPSWETVIALAKALGVTADAFLQEPQERPSPGPGRPRKATGAETEQRPAVFEALIKELAQVTVAHVNKELRRKKWGLKSAKWKSAFAEENGGENNTDPRVGKFRVVLPNGKVFAKLDLPIEGADVMVRIWRIKDQWFASGESRIRSSPRKNGMG
jgi:transcriptional regulator with XRE-family HTH domain